MLLVSALSACVSSPSTAPEAPTWTPSTSRGTPYADLREELVAQGFEPVRLNSAEACSAPVCHSELFACALPNLCLYTWRKGSSVFEIQTSSDFARIARPLRAPSFEESYGIRWGQPYEEARPALIAKGFQPVAQDGTGCYGDCYPEAVACAGTGEAPCVFQWRRGEVFFRVGTINEIRNVVTIAE
ncbi:MAG: hypothetical protein IT535_14160 [Bauldia sp.]|nr:hypothetical protein [Bauldia sp.]